MTAENETKPDEQTAQQPRQANPSSDASEPSMADVVQAMKSQQEVTAKGFAELTSGLSQFLEKMAAVAAPAAAQPKGVAPAESSTSEAPQKAPAAAEKAPQDAPAQAEPTPAQGQAPQAHAVAPPPVDPAGYVQSVPAPGFPQAAPQAAAPTGFPAPGQPQAAPATGFPAAHDPQTPVPQAPVAATPVPQAATPQNPAQQASPGFPDVGKPVRASRDFIRGKRAVQAQPVGPPQPQQPQQPQQPVQDDRWKNIFFGPDLANNQALTALRDKVVEGLLGGDRNTTGLAGTILLFQAATPDRMPQILKDVGEAYYRWHPRTALGNDPLRNALVTWIHRKCESVGVSNTIEIVQPGDRFEASRHNSKQRGVEVTQVAGWVVLRDNGKVYTKATVAVK